MKKLNFTKGLLWVVTLLGGTISAQGWFTGEELSSVQSILGMALGGGGITAIGLITVLQQLAPLLVKKAYEFAVAKYGQVAVDNFVNKIDDVLAMLNANNTLLNEVQQLLIEAKETRQALLDE